MQFLRSKGFDLFLGLWTALVALAVPALWLFGAPARQVRAVARFWMRGVGFGLRAIVGLDYRQRGRENIPAEACLIIANHQSPWETLLLALVFPEASLVAKAELARIPVFGWFLMRYPMILIDRASGTSALRKMVTQSRAALDEGRHVIVFPEGTRKHLADPVKFRRGIELLYVELGRPVLPLALNSGVFWGPDQPVRRRGTITLSYLPPIQPGLSRQDFMQRAEAVLQTEKERLLAETRP